MPAEEEPLGQFPAKFTVGEESAGARLDAFLASVTEGVSRSALRRAIDAGHVTVDDSTVKPSFRLTQGMKVRLERLEPSSEGPEPEAIPLDLIYEDDDLVAVNKPPGMVVHPAKGHWAGTLASALAHHFGSQLSSVGGPTRPGIVHRLDRDTSGVIVVAKHDRAHEKLAAQFADRTTEKTYEAIVLGVPDRDADLVDEPIGPHPRVREKMAIRRDHPDARPAQTKFEVVERFERFAHVRCMPKTGRTHQIRVHLQHAGFPILCDKLYGGRALITESELHGKAAGPDEQSVLGRQALHARRLRIDHPTSGERLELEAPMAEDLTRVIEALRGD